MARKPAKPPDQEAPTPTHVDALPQGLDKRVQKEQARYFEKLVELLGSDLSDEELREARARLKDEFSPIEEELNREVADAILRRGEEDLRRYERVPKEFAEETIRDFVEPLRRAKARELEVRNRLELAKIELEDPAIPKDYRDELMEEIRNLVPWIPEYEELGKAERRGYSQRSRPTRRQKAVERKQKLQEWASEEWKKHPSLSQRHLIDRVAKREGCSPSTAKRAIDEAIESGFLVRPKKVGSRSTAR